MFYGAHQLNPKLSLTCVTTYTQKVKNANVFYEQSANASSDQKLTT
jgi:hypothetical protein